jgi:hypothetical protein
MFDFLEPDEPELCDQVSITRNNFIHIVKIEHTKHDLFMNGNFIDVPCPSHDHPILMVPKEFRRQFLDDLLENDETKHRIFNDKEFDWVFHETPCTICTSIYAALLKRLHSPQNVFGMIYARPYRFSRRLGEGISVYNPGDKPMRQTVLVNPMLQQRINALLKDSNLVKYIFLKIRKNQQRHLRSNGYKIT